MMFFCCELCLSTFPNVAFQGFWSRLEVETATSVPVGALSRAYFYVLTTGLMFLGSGSILPGCWVLPCPPPLIPPPQQWARIAVGRVRLFGFPAVCSEKRGSERCESINKRRRMTRRSTSKMNQGRIQRTGGKNGEMDERRTKRREERWMSRDGWVTWLLSE